MLKNLIFLGPPGAGKGTIAMQVAKQGHWVHISTGDIFRKNIKEMTPLGQQVEQILARGDYVPDEITNALVKNRLAEPDAQDGYILDGYPRTMGQAEALQTFSKVNAVIDFVLPHAEIIRRLSGRLVCKHCGANYHREAMPSRQEGICDRCQHELMTRPDDEPEAIQHRLQVYEQKTLSLIDFYQNLGLLHRLNAEPASKDVLEQLLMLLRMESI